MHPNKYKMHGLENYNLYFEMEFFLIAIAGKIFSYPFNDSIFHNKSGTYNQSCCGT